jgi:hypothetical protein
MPPTKSPRPPAGKKGGAQRPVKPKGAVTTALRRYNMLSQPVTNQLTIDDLVSRMTMMLEEAGERNLLHKAIHDSLVFDKIHAAVARHWYCTMSSRNYIIEDEAACFSKICATHVSTMRVLRSRVPLQKVQAMLALCLQEEDLTRRKIMFLQHKMFHDFFEQLLIEVRAIAERQRKEAVLRKRLVCTARADEEDRRADGEPNESEAADVERHESDSEPVKLPSGCPFVHSEHCPFHSAAWVDRQSYCDQHDRNKYPRLKFPLSLEQRSYDELLRSKAAAAASVNFRMFGHTSGLSRPTSASSARR